MRTGKYERKMAKKVKRAAVKITFICLTKRQLLWHFINFTRLVYHSLERYKVEYIFLIPFQTFLLLIISQVKLLDNPKIKYNLIFILFNSHMLTPTPTTMLSLHHLSQI